MGVSGGGAATYSARRLAACAAPRMLGERQRLTTDPLLLQVLHNEDGRLLGRGGGGIDDQLGLEWELVGVVDASKVLELAGSRFLVQPLGVALFAGFDGS